MCGKVNTNGACVHVLATPNEYKRHFFGSGPLHGAVQLTSKHVLGCKLGESEQFRVYSGAHDIQWH